MNLRPKLKSSHVAIVIGILLGAGSGFLLHDRRLGSGLVRWSYDLLHVWRGDRPPGEAVLVYLDEASHQKLGQPFNAPWDRSLHAKLVKRLSQAGARAVVFDIVFSDPNTNNPAADQELANAIRESGRVILAADTVMTGSGEKQAIPPFDLVREAAAAKGSDELAPDSDLVIRLHTPRADNPLPSMAWATATFVGAAVAKDESRESEERWMNYYGPPNFLASVSYYEALDPSAVPDSVFRGKFVFVGARMQTKFSGERKDEYANPFSVWLTQRMRNSQGALYSAGAEIQATAFLNLLKGDWLRRTRFGTETVVLIALGVFFGVALTRLHPAWATVLAIASLAVMLALAYAFFVLKLTWFPWLIAFTQIGICLGWSLLFNSLQLYVQKRLYEQTLRLYLPPKLVKKFAGSPELLKPGATKQTLTLLFSDIADFTTLSEGMDPDELAELMNHYFENAVSRCIHHKEGTVAKYIGDAIFAFWNAPDAQTDHALLACEAALLFRDQSVEPIRGRKLRTRIGLHTGVANVGNFGSLQRVDYTALGDSVNLASRLEGLNKHLGTDCLMSSATKKLIGDRLITRALGSFQLKGFEGLVEVHELVSRPENGDESRPWREAFDGAMNNFLNRDLEFAAMGFRRVLELKPGDGPAQFFLKRVAELSAEAIPDNWATHTMLKEK